MDLGFEMDSLDIEIPVKLTNGKVVTFNVIKELAVNEEDLTNHFMEQSGKYAWWAVLAETAKSHKEFREVAVDTAEARADKIVRRELEVEGTKVTEALVKSRIKLNDGYLTALEDYNKAKKNASIIEKVVRAFEHRKDMLMVAGSHIRSTMGNSGDLRSLKNMANDITSR